MTAMQIRDRLGGRFEQRAVAVEELERHRDDGVGENIHQDSVDWDGRCVADGRTLQPRMRTAGLAAIVTERAAIIAEWPPR